MTALEEITDAHRLRSRVTTLQRSIDHVDADTGTPHGVQHERQWTTWAAAEIDESARRRKL